MRIWRSVLSSICILGLSLFFAACGTNSPVQTGSGRSLEKNDGYSEEADTIGQAGNGPKILVAYFSCTGNTKMIAEYTAEILQADLYEIIPEIAYTDDDLNYSNDKSCSSIEQNDISARPAISSSVENMGDYDIVFLGYPIWWGEAPKIMNTFLESYSFEGKTIIPFCTSGSSGIGSSAENLHAVVSDEAEWLSGTRFSGNTSKENVAEWIQSIGIDIK